MNNFSNNQIIQKFKELIYAYKDDDNLNINQCTYTSIDNLNAGMGLDDTVQSGANTYPLLNCYHQLASISTNTIKIDFELSYFDTLLKNKSNTINIWDNATNTLGYILRNLELNNDFIFKNVDTSIEYFIYDLDDECAGAKASISVVFDISFCGK